MAYFGLARASAFENLEWFTDKDLALWIISHISPFGSSICDIGAGTGFMIPYYRPWFVKIVGIDPSLPMLLQARSKERVAEGVALYCGIAEALPFRDYSVDVAIAKSSLHHFDAPYNGLKESARVARFLIAVIEVVAPTHACLPFASKIVLSKEKERRLVFSEEDLSAIVGNVKGSVRTLLYDQYIDVKKWLDTGEIDADEKRELFQAVARQDGNVRRDMQIHWRSGRLYMLRRLALVLGV